MSLPFLNTAPGYDEELRNSVFFERGLHATSICGAVGAAVAVAMLQGQDEAGIASAAGIAASMGAGLLEANRTGGTVKRVHCGWAAHCGVAAADLARHDCLVYSSVQGDDRWNFSGPSGEEVSVPVAGSLRSNNLSAVLAACRAGMGLAVLPWYVARESLGDGSIVPVLADQALPSQELHAVFPSPKLVPGKVRSFIEFLKTQLDGEWFNGVQENLLAVLTAGGISPVKGPSGDVNLRDAIYGMIDGRTRTVLSNHYNCYVSPSGNDANPGTIGAPFLTRGRSTTFTWM